MVREEEKHAQELGCLLERLLRYPVDPAQRDRLWQGITAALDPPVRSKPH